MTFYDIRKETKYERGEFKKKRSIDNKSKSDIHDYYKAGLRTGRVSEELLSELAEKYGRSTRQIQRYIAEVENGKGETKEKRRLAEQEKTDQKWQEQHLFKEQDKHIDEIKQLIEDWQSCIFTPRLIELMPTLKGHHFDYEHPIEMLEADRLFDSLKWHLPFPNLWINHFIWSHWISWYKACAEWLPAQVLQTADDLEEKLKRGSGHLGWINIDISAYCTSVIKQIDTRLAYADTEDSFFIRRTAKELKRGDDNTLNMRIENASSDQDGKKKGYTQILYVDDKAIGECLDSDLAIQSYNDDLNRHLSCEEADRMMILYHELATLASAMHEIIDLALQRVEYAHYTCPFCPLHDKAFTGSAKKSWATDKEYRTALNDHFDKLYSVGSALVSNLDHLTDYKRKHRGKYIPRIIEGNVVDGAALYYGFSYLGGIKPVDGLLALCSIIHFNALHPKLAIYEDWRDVTLDNLNSRIIKAFKLMVNDKQFEFCPSCPVCGALPYVFEFKQL